MPLINLSSLVLFSDDSTEPQRFAAEQLQHYLQRVLGQPLERRPGSGGGPLSLILAPPDTAHTPVSVPSRGYAIHVTPTGLALVGCNPRELLNACYALLAACGCRWALTPEHDEIVPRLHGPIDISSVQHAAPFDIRGYCTDIMTWHYTQPAEFHSRLPDDRHFIDWMGKTGANSFLFIRHPFDTQLTIPELLPALRERGIDVEYGGHVLPLLLPRELFQTHPDYFAMNRKGERNEQSNLCPSNPAAMALVSDNAVQYVRDYPEQTALHIWGADVLGGAWCHCSNCAGLTAQDQSLHVCNAVSLALRQAGLARPVCYLAYHDTMDAQLSVVPDRNVVCEYAPRERCYGHALDDGSCKTNRRYAAALEAYVARFAGRVRIFEYYGDAILYFGCAIPMTSVIEADLAYFRRLGIRDVLMLQFGRFSTFAYAPNFFCFAAQTEGQPADQLCDAYWRHFGHDAELARHAHRRLESIWATVATYGDIRLRPRDAGRAETVARAIEVAIPQLGEVAQQLAATTAPELRDLGLLTRYSQTVLEGVLQEARGGEPADLLFARALEHIQPIDQRRKGLWGELDLPMIHSFYAAARFMLQT